MPASEPAITIPSPVCRGDRVYVTSAYTIGCDLIKLVPKGEKFEAEAVYEESARKVVQNHHGGVVLLDGHVYGYSEGRGWTCQKLDTGESAWASRKLGKGSVVYADGCLFCHDESDGTLAVIEATPERILTGPRSWFMNDRRFSFILRANF